MLKKQFLLPVLIVTVIAGSSFYLGFLRGQNTRPEIEKVTGLTGKELGKPGDADFSKFWGVWNLLNEKYVSENGATGTATTTVSNQEKVWGAIEGLVKSLGDPYTIFLPPQKSAIFEGDIRGNFEGVGMEIATRNNVLTVIAPLKDSPAAQAGIHPGDAILEINGTSTSDMSVEEAVNLIRGPKGSLVHLTIYREGEKETRKINIARDVINIPTIDTEIYKKLGHENEPVFVIRLYNFSATSIDLFRKALVEFEKANTDKMIIDLRGNPGGFLEAAVDIASWFLPEGKLVVREYSGPTIPSKDHRSRGYNVFTDKLKLVILINQGSASASEILAGALSEYDKATLVGEKTFGKGSVQELVELPDGGSVKVTVARWLTPNGHSISKEGLAPDIKVTMTEEDIEKKRDPQFDKAVEILLK